MIEVNKLKGKLHKYKVPDLNVNFVNRENEFEKFLGLIKYHEEVNPVNSLIYVISGPWGCGKTEFAKALTYVLKDVDDIIISYMNLPRSSIEEEFFATTSKNIVEIMESLVRELLGDRVRLLLHVYDVVKYIASRIRLKDKRIILIFDEVTVTLERYKVTIRDLIAGLSKEIYDLAWKYHCQVNVILLTSELTTMYYFKREEGKNLLIYQMWHLSKKPFEQLLSKLNCPLNFAMLWKLTGGNPRAIYELFSYKWNLEMWLDRIIEVTSSAFKEFCRVKGLTLGQILGETRNVMENIDNLELHPIWDFLLKYNLVTQLYNKWLNKRPEETYWIGRHVAFQMPVYYLIVKSFIEKRTLDVSPQDITIMIEEFGKS